LELLGESRLGDGLVVDDVHCLVDVVELVLCDCDVPAEGEDDFQLELVELVEVDVCEAGEGLVVEGDVLHELVCDEQAGGENTLGVVGRDDQLALADQPGHVDNRREDDVVGADLVGAHELKVLVVLAQGHGDVGKHVFVLVGRDLHEVGLDSAVELLHT